MDNFAIRFLNDGIACIFQPINSKYKKSQENVPVNIGGQTSV